jgi:hypothetical protein
VPRSSVCPVPFRFSIQYFVCISQLSHVCYKPSPCTYFLFIIPYILCPFSSLKSLFMNASVPHIDVILTSARSAPLQRWAEILMQRLPLLSMAVCNHR